MTEKEKQAQTFHTKKQMAKYTWQKEKGNNIGSTQLLRSRIDRPNAKSAKPWLQFLCNTSKSQHYRSLGRFQKIWEKIKMEGVFFADEDHLQDEDWGPDIFPVK